MVPDIGASGMEKYLLLDIFCVLSQRRAEPAGDEPSWRSMRCVVRVTLFRARGLRIFVLFHLFFGVPLFTYCDINRTQLVQTLCLKRHQKKSGGSTLKLRSDIIFTLCVI
jgi:hypothetical protein